ncbi:hypothetical protein EVAR_74381_1 [Eumeta japonica]|uniref:Uncharacterized protein n=1 Tax=Eumeta variegata TaxID=151549 RepID=A0A4C1SFB4_EUMVA|nr:hypothetical protein EVAR_74381_1 [Eumeta japonica]
MSIILKSLYQFLRKDVKWVWNINYDKETSAFIFNITEYHQFSYGRNFTLRSRHKFFSYTFGNNKGIPLPVALASPGDLTIVREIANCPADATSRANISTSRLTSQKTRRNEGLSKLRPSEFPDRLNMLQLRRRKIHC